MLYRLLLAAALVTVPAIGVAQPPAPANTQQADTSKAHAKKSTAHHKKSHKKTAKPAPQDTTKKPS